MFSYRHAFHAGNHADVLKHTILLAVLKHMALKDQALMVVDTHAGAGAYQLDDRYAQTSGEAAEGFLRLVAGLEGLSAPERARLAPILQDYLEMVGSFNRAGHYRHYPGSPMIIQQQLRERDRLKLFELHPSDAKNLAINVIALKAGRQIEVFREDGFEGVKRFLPPPSRRALVLTDPSYEIKSDYAKVAAMANDAIKRFATGTFVFWYPIIARHEAHDLPRKLRALATRSGKSWLHASLTVKSSARRSPTALGEGNDKRPGLTASGVVVINPPYTLQAALAQALPQLVSLLGQDRFAGHTLDAGG